MNEKKVCISKEATAGQVFSLEKVESRITEEAILFSAGWKPQKKSEDEKFDVDIIAIAVDANGQAVTNGVLFYGVAQAQKLPEGSPFEVLNGAMKHTGDNRDGEGEGDDETIVLNLPELPTEVAKVILFADIYQGVERAQNFGRILDAYLRILPEDGTEVLFSKLGDQFADATGVHLASFVRNEQSEMGEWDFEPVLQPANGGVSTILSQYGVTTTQQS